MVIASIDLMDGKSVQLRQGKKPVLQHDDPLGLARKFNRYGQIAVIDLDAAKGTGHNKDIVKNILKIADCRVGGGIRTIDQAVEFITCGAAKIIIGSQAFSNQGINKRFLDELIYAIGKRHIIIAIDAIGSEIVTRAWTHHTGLNILRVVRDLQEYCSEFLFTCVEREGLMSGTDIKMVTRLVKRTQHRITLAGGVHTLEEIGTCAKLGVDVQLGMALYTGRIDLGSAFIASLNWKTNLLPTIVQDDNGQVLMLAYSNKESLNKVFGTNTMWYFSRSRKTLWQKGGTSGNVQHVIRLRADCDQDTILATVHQDGVACHTGRYSCFGDRRICQKKV
jgi:phosphoribosyl-ATP pyrophosphohydrolase/phosphoribosyl-AMP cyclohydrolase